MYLNYYDYNSLEHVKEQSEKEIHAYLIRLSIYYKIYGDSSRGTKEQTEAFLIVKKNVYEVKNEYSMYFI